MKHNFIPQPKPRDPNAPLQLQITYTASYSVCGKLYSIRTTELEAFKTAVNRLKAAFPNLPVHLFETKDMI